MACDATLGRLEPCKDSVGGLKSIYFVNYAATALSGATLDTDGIVTAFGTALTLYKYDLKGTNSFDEANENSRENGTSFWTQTGTIVLKKQDAVTQKELRLISYGRPIIFVEDYNGNYRIAGFENGCEVAVSSASGAGMGDLNGYNLTFTGQEKNLATFVTASIINDTTNTVVVVGT